MKAITVSGRFGMWTVIGAAEEQHPSGKTWVRARCDCGSERDVPASRLRSGGSASCGCGRIDAAASGKRTHGMTGSSEFSSWREMRARCTPGTSSYRRNFANYGARGIAVCARWATFEAFFADMGPKPSPAHTIDRIDNARGYEPGNCRWATKAEQRKNSRTARAIPFRGQTLTLSEVAAQTGIKRQALARRIDKGMTVEEAVSAPILTHAQAGSLAKGGWGGARIGRAS